MALKVEIINGAYSRGRISGLTRSPTPSDLALALDRLESMAALWEERNICAGYNFEDSPDLNSDSGLERSSYNAFESNLAMLLLADFGKQPTPTLVMEAAGTFSALSGATARVNPILPPNRQPIGSSNSLRYGRWQRYYRNTEQAPNTCATVRMIEGDVDDFTEHFDTWLTAGETVSSQTTVSNDPTKLVVSNITLTSPDVSYRVTAAEPGTYYVTVKATSSIGRIETRKINFVVSEVESA